MAPPPSLSVLAATPHSLRYFYRGGQQMERTLQALVADCVPGPLKAFLETLTGNWGDGAEGADDASDILATNPWKQPQLTVIEVGAGTETSNRSVHVDFVNDRGNKFVVDSVGGSEPDDVAIIELRFNHSSGR